MIQHGIATAGDPRQVAKLERDSAALLKKYEKELLVARRARIQAAADAWQFATEIDRLTGVLPADVKP